MGKSAKILLIDDEELLLQKLAQRIRGLGHEVDPVENIEDAMVFLYENKYDLVISDIHLPGKSGTELLDWANQEQPNLKIILITGHLDETNIKDALDRGCYGFLAKPISKEELEKIINNSLSEDYVDIISDSDYAKIDIDDFICGNVVNFPVYIKLSDSRFLKIAHTGTQINLEQVSELKEKGVLELWINSENLDDYLNLSNKIIKLKTKDPNWTNEKKLKLIKHASDLAFENLRLSGINEDTIKYGLDSLKTMLGTLSKLERSVTLVDLLQNHKVKNHYTNAVVGATFSGLIARIMGWTNEKNITNLMLGSFLRDIGLIHFDEELLRKPLKKLDLDELKQYKSHPQLGFEVLQEIDDLPEEVLQIVLQHHEDGTNDSFPYQTPYYKIHPMAKIVRVIDHFLTYYFDAIENGKHLKAYELTRFGLKKYYNEDASKALRALLKNNDLIQAQKEFNRN